MSSCGDRNSDLAARRQVLPQRDCRYSPKGNAAHGGAHAGVGEMIRKQRVSGADQRPHVPPAASAKGRGRDRCGVVRTRGGETTSGRGRCWLTSSLGKERCFPTDSLFFTSSLLLNVCVHR